MELNDFIEYEIDGCKCFWPGSRASLAEHIADVKRRRAKSPHIVDLSKPGRQLKQSKSQNIKTHALTVNPNRER